MTVRPLDYLPHEDRFDNLRRALAAAEERREAAECDAVMQALAQVRGKAK